MKHTLIALGVVVLMSLGQILFKLSAVAWNAAQTVYDSKVLLTITGAVLVYAATSLAWIYLLRTAELGKVYPMVAIAFILVPVSSYFIFNEEFSLSYKAGVVFILIGVALTQRV